MMEPLRYEKYDYVLLVCRNEVDYANLLRLFGLEDAKVLIANKRRIKARAVWFDDVADQIVPKPEKIFTDEEEPQTEEDEESSEDGGEDEEEESEEKDE